MIRSVLATGLLALFCSGLTYGQINLSSFRSRSVRQGYSTNTRIDSLLLKTSVNGGSACTRMTIVAQPGVYNYPIKKPIVYHDSLIILPNIDLFDQVIILDSVEMTLSLNLPSDFTVDSMWLWIDGKPVEAQIQDRALAASQYQQIVGTRLDPAILQYSGNGYYDLRIFPAKSLEARKIEIQFHHIFNDSSGLIAAHIPVTFDSSYNYSKYDPLPRRIGFVNATFTTGDNLTYEVSIPGIGSGTFSSTMALNLSSSNVSQLKPVIIKANDPSGSNEFLWLAKDKLTGHATAGITTSLSASDVTFENEPDTRIIAIDIRNSIWNWNDYYKARAENLGRAYTNSSYQDQDVLTRAQKYVLLCLEHYLSDTQKFNIVFGGAQVTTLFPEPVQAHPEYIKQAIEAVLKMSANSASSTMQVMQTACAQANSGIVILVSDLFEPYAYYDYKLGVNTSTVNEIGKVYDNTIESVGKIVDSTGVVLFTIDDNYRLSEISYMSGGFRLGSILNKYNIDYRYEVVNGRRMMIPMMPPLFGSRNNSGIRNLTVTSNDLDNIVFTTDGYSYNYWYSTRPMMDVALSAPYYYPYNVSEAVLQIAGGITGDQSAATFTISGRLGGLKFKKIVNAGTTLNNSGKNGEVQWAFRKSEALAQANYSKNALLVKAIGKEYHIITRQTSLLALEPWMKLWEDTLVATTVSPVFTARQSTTSNDLLFAKDGGAPTSAIGTGIDLDGISLEDLANHQGVLAVEDNNPAKRSADFAIGVTKRTINLSLPGVKGDIVLQLFDLKGSLVLQKKLSASERSGSTYAWNIDSKTSRISKGFYMLHITTDFQTKVFRIPLVGK